MSELDQQLLDLKPSPNVQVFVHALDAKRALATDRRANYLSLRPHQIGAIAVYAHSKHVSIAVDPRKAVGLQATQPFTEQIRKTPSTTYLIVRDQHLGAHHERVLALALESVDWRSTGPASPLGAGRSGLTTSDPDTCPDCWTEITPAGGCWC